MTKSNGIKDLKQAAKLLNKHSPDGESLAYINPEEAKLLRSHGGTGIQTLSGVPSYWSFPEWVPFVGGDDLTEVAGDVWNWATDRYKNKPASKDDKGKTIPGQSGIGNLAKDALSVWGALKAKKDQEGLNAAEMEQFNKLNQQLAAAETQFNVDTDFGTQLKAPQNVPETIEDVSVFKETTGRPDMVTTAVAEGGRIGYSNGGYKNWLSSKGFDDMMIGMSGDEIIKLYDSVRGTWSKAHGGRIGYNMGGIDTPFQGIGALNPRMGYQMGSPHGQAIPTFSEGVEQMYESGPAGVDTETINWERESPYGAIADLLKGTGVQESETTDYNTVPYPVIREKMKSYAGMIGSDNIYDIIKIATQVGDKEFVDYLRKTFTAEGNQWIEDPGMEWKESKQWGALGAAHGGRIGYGLGSKTATAYADPNKVVTGDPKENLLSYFSNKYSGNEQGSSGDNFMANMIPQSSQGSQYQLLNEYQNYVTEVGEENAVPFEEWKASQVTGMPGVVAAQGGRIGYQKGTHPLDDVAMQMFGMTFENLNPLQQIVVSQSQSKAQGGRIGAEKGGIMPLLDMGGMEKDYRQDGGFVPIGRREKADDVPARLSKNEFVFTADAVKAAGGGDIDEGAQRMYNVMKNLEAGGEISEQSQGQG